MSDQLDKVFASASKLEKLDISGGDHDVVINNGVAFGVNCESAGEILKIGTTEQTGYTTVPLQAGMNLIEIVKVYQTGSIVADAIDLVAW